jgi:hypothetical protein
MMALRRLWPWSNFDTSTLKGLRRVPNTLNRRRPWTAYDRALLLLGGTFGRNTRPGEDWVCSNCGRKNNSGPRCTKCGEERVENQQTKPVYE